MNPVLWIIFGAVAGWIAGRLYGDDRPEGCVTNIVLGIGGALLGGAVYTLITGRDFTAGFNLPSLIVAILGALLLIFILRRLGRSRYWAEVRAGRYAILPCGFRLRYVAQSDHIFCPRSDSALVPAHRG
jgi:uncharacterized membrane protein YeaQ/YmgE (transglycosylase-associated protein family)